MAWGSGGRGSAHHRSSCPLTPPHRPRPAPARRDYNQKHFVRSEGFHEAADGITGPLRKIFIEFLERSCTAGEPAGVGGGGAVGAHGREGMVTGG